jgi:hypothetical protein
MQNMQMPNNNGPKQELQALLERVRQQSLEASRRGDFRLVAKLTMETARINALCSEAGETARPSLLSLI